MIKPGVFRFILALTVVFHHISKVGFMGHFAVFCFFMLSGYWITNMFDAKYRVSSNALASFYASRLWRLLPVYILINTLTILIYNYLHHDFIYSYTNDLTIGGKLGFFLTNVFILGFNFFPRQVLAPAWSLDIELQYYLLFPFIFPVIYWAKPRMNALLAGASLAVVALSVFLPQSIVSKTILYYFLYFLIGMVIYQRKLSFSRTTEIVCLLLFFFALGIHCLLPSLRAATVYAHDSDYNRHLNELLPFLMIPLISNSVRIKSSATDITLGNMSYVVYLLHWAFMTPYLYYVSDVSTVTRLFYTLLYLGATLLFSYLIYTFFDKPLNDLRKKWTTSLQLA